MKKKFTLGVIGANETAHSIVYGLVSSMVLREKKIIIGSENEADFDKFEEFNIITTTSLKTVAENSEYVLFAAEPSRFLETIAAFEGATPERVISVVPGVTRYKLRRAFGGKTKVCRMSANAATAIGHGVIIADFSEFGIDERQYITNLFSSFGGFISMPEDKFDISSALSDCGTAYVYAFIKALADFGLKNGLSEGEACDIAIRTVDGASCLIMNESEETIREKITAACAGNEATAKGVRALEEGGFSEILEKAANESVGALKEILK